MADRGDGDVGDGNIARGNDWEVVSLTASAYAASPGPKQVEFKDDNKDDSHHDDAETSHALLMSRHFALAPGETENSPLDTINTEIHDEKERRSRQKDEEDLALEDLGLSDKSREVQCFNEKEKQEENIYRAAALEKGKQEESIYSAAALGSFHDETIVRGSAYEEKDSASEPTQPGLDFGSDISSPVLKHEEDEEKHDGSKMPCEAWWRRSAASLYAHAKEANAFWSVFVAATVMGLVIIGQRWQQERRQVLQLKWQFGTNNEKPGRMAGSILRLKEVIVGGERRGSFIRTSPNDN